MVAVAKTGVAMLAGSGVLAQDVHGIPLVDGIPHPHPGPSQNGNGNPDAEHPDGGWGNDSDSTAADPVADQSLRDMLRETMREINHTDSTEWGEHVAETFNTTNATVQDIQEFLRQFIGSSFHDGQIAELCNGESGSQLVTEVLASLAQLSPQDRANILRDFCQAHEIESSVNGTTNNTSQNPATRPPTTTVAQQDLSTTTSQNPTTQYPVGQYESTTKNGQATSLASGDTAGGGNNDRLLRDMGYKAVAGAVLAILVLGLYHNKQKCKDAGHLVCSKFGELTCCPTRLFMGQGNGAQPAQPPGPEARVVGIPSGELDARAEVASAGSAGQEVEVAGQDRGMSPA